ncbi:hypothetical protein CDD83_9481 [Cordyceps sp. RAO-2017]|nr:hypothetical protein CDD83_9481 [Cordyceps sp. RAO-2017]
MQALADGRPAVSDRLELALPRPSSPTRPIGGVASHGRSGRARGRLSGKTCHIPNSRRRAECFLCSGSRQLPATVVFLLQPLRTRRMYTAGERRLGTGAARHADRGWTLLAAWPVVCTLQQPARGPPVRVEVRRGPPRPEARGLQSSERIGLAGQCNAAGTGERRLGLTLADAHWAAALGTTAYL